MHKLEITGETPDALYLNVINTLSLFLRGPQQVAPAEPAKEAPVEAVDSEVLRPTTDGSNSTGATQKKRRGSKNAEPAVLNDEIPDLAKTTEAKPVLTLDGDIRPRLQAIQAACTKRGWDMPQCVSYIQRLYGPFGIANAKQLRSEQFEEFLEASDAYLSGEA